MGGRGGAIGWAEWFGAWGLGYDGDVIVRGKKRADTCCNAKLIGCIFVIGLLLCTLSASQGSL